LHEGKSQLRTRHNMKHEITVLRDGKFLAGYYFGTPEVVKYLSQFIESGVSFGNHVPVDLLRKFLVYFSCHAC
jgi:hypothetical protein